MSGGHNRCARGCWKPAHQWGHPSFKYGQLLDSQHHHPQLAVSLQQSAPLPHMTAQPPPPTFPHPPGAGLNDTCQQRDGVSGVSNSRPASVWRMYTHLQAPQMCTAMFTLMTHTWHKTLHDKEKKKCIYYFICAVLWWHYWDTTFHSETPPKCSEWK